MRHWAVITLWCKVSCGATPRRRPDHDYVPWTDVEQVDFDRAPAMHPPPGGRSLSPGQRTARMTAHGNGALKHGLDACRTPACPESRCPCYQPIYLNVRLSDRDLMRVRRLPADRVRCKSRRFNSVDPSMQTIPSPNRATIFAPQDTVYLSVLTTGGGSGTISVRWTYGGKVVGEPKKRVANQDVAATEFTLQSAAGFPPGQYSAEIFLDGKSVGTRTFRVQGSGDRLKISSAMVRSLGSV